MRSPQPALLASALALALLPGLACRRTGQPVAEVASQVVGAAEWRRFLGHQPSDLPAQEALAALVRREVAWEQARKTGLLDSDSWRAVEPKLRRTVLVRAYLDSLPGQPPASEEAVKSYWLSHNEERHILHVLCTTQAAAAAARKRLEAGEPFEKVARSVSTDPGAPRNGGDLGWVKRSSVVSEFGKAAFAAEVGQLVGPFQSKFGWHVAQVKEKRAPSVQEFERNRSLLMDDAHDVANGPKRVGALKGLAEKFPLQVDAKVLDLDQTLEVAPGDAGRIAGKVAGLQLSLAELKEFMAEAMASGQMHSISAPVKQRFLELLAEEARLEAMARKAGLDDRPEVRAALWDTLHTAVYNGFAASYLRKLAIPDAELEAHLAAHPDRFRSVGAVRVYLLVGNDPQTVAKAAAEARNGTPWKDLVARFGNRESTGNWDAGFLESAALEKLLPKDAVKALLDAPLDGVVGPIPSPEGPVLFKVLERRAGALLPLAQCRDAVRADLVKVKGTALVDAFLDGDGRKGLTIRTYPDRARR